MGMTDQAEELLTKTSAYTDGYDAYWDGVMYEQNPYTFSSMDHSRWQQGWLAAEGADVVDDNIS